MPDADSRERILSAARSVFARKGKHGARMDEIALEAGVNKAMLYYYYSAKELLYREVLAIEIIKVNESVSGELLFTEAESARKKLEKYVDLHFARSEDLISGKLTFQAVVNEPDDLRRALKLAREKAGTTKIEPPPMILLSIIEEGIRSGEFWDVDARQLTLSLFGLFFIGTSGSTIIEAFLGLSTDDREAFLSARKQSVKDLMLHGILRRISPPR
jgi:TetR/AcrR family transcriptional regulator